MKAKLTYHAWLAREESGEVCQHSRKPEYGTYYEYQDDSFGLGDSMGKYRGWHTELDEHGVPYETPTYIGNNDLFPSLTFDNSPIEVKVTIETIKR